MCLIGSLPLNVMTNKIDIFENPVFFLNPLKVNSISCCLQLSDSYCSLKINGFSLSGARFNKEVQPTLSLNLNSELTYSQMGNSEFSVTEQLNCVSLLNSK